MIVKTYSLSRKMTYLAKYKVWISKLIKRKLKTHSSD